MVFARHEGKLEKLKRPDVSVKSCNPRFYLDYPWSKALIYSFSVLEE